MVLHNRYAVQLLGVTDQFVCNARYHKTSPLEKATLYLRAHDAENLAKRWNNRRESPYYTDEVKAKWPLAIVVPVCVGLDAEERGN